MDFIRRTWSEIDLDALDYNTKSIKAKMDGGKPASFQAGSQTCKKRSGPFAVHQLFPTPGSSVRARKL